MIADTIIKEIKQYSERDFVVWVSPILQIQEGGYGENDKLYGVRVPNLRKIANKYTFISFDDVELLLNDDYHEVRLLALFILVNKFKADKNMRKKIVDLYIKNADNINNWDLVDMSAPYIIGHYIYENKKDLSIINQLANSKHLWKERIAIVATQYFIKQGFYEPTIKLVEKYLTHDHHLIHKASGWMLRELGKKDIEELRSFLDKYASRMPRTMLRYAIERLNEQERKHYMSIK